MRKKIILLFQVFFSLISNKLTPAIDVCSHNLSQESQKDLNYWWKIGKNKRKLMCEKNLYYPILSRDVWLARFESTVEISCLDLLSRLHTI